MNKRMTVFFSTLSILFAVAAHADLANCIDVSQNSPSIGAQCKTSKGFVFTRVEHGWTDLSSGKTWNDKMKTNLTQHEARVYCGLRNKVLPSNHDLLLAETHGLREVLKDMSGQWFWSGSRPPQDDLTGGFSFFGNTENGISTYDLRYFACENTYTRCVERLKN